ncbi:hypothetical protein SEA_KARDASHIAN_35 [Streptomyces phage Kardashian]|nr:hypothetical protein SEA_KARDASHIAN_35 [Streptomyces phage Kardashian]
MLGNPKKKRSVRISLDRDDNKGAYPSEDPFIRPETVKLAAEKTKEVAKFVAITAVGAYAAIKTIQTLSEIALKKTKSADKED